MSTKMDETQYWIKRHEVKSGSLASVGQKSYSDAANYYSYRQVLERYNLLLDQLKFSLTPVRVLDAGGGRGVFLDLFLARKYAVNLVDISPAAIEDIQKRYGNAVDAKACDLLDMPQDITCDIVHCFDVLYHILDDNKWSKILEIFARVSSRYIILHERFLTRRPLILAKHIRFRSYNTTANRLRELGFKEVKTLPTRFWNGRILSYRIAPMAPAFFYQLDKLTLGLLDRYGLTNWGAYHIKVFEKTRH